MKSLLESKIIFRPSTDLSGEKNEVDNDVRIKKDQHRVKIKTRTFLLSMETQFFIN